MEVDKEFELSGNKIIINTDGATNMQVHYSRLCNEIYVTTTEFKDNKFYQHQFTINMTTGEFVVNKDGDEM